MKATVFTCESKEDVLEEIKKVFEEAEAERTKIRERKETVGILAKAIGKILLEEEEIEVKLETLCVSILATIYNGDGDAAQTRGSILCVIENLISMDRNLIHKIAVISKMSEPESQEHSEPDAETSPAESSQG